jgi:MFS family permease
MAAMLLFGIIGSMDMPSRRTLIFQLSAEKELAFTIGYVEFLVGLAGVVGYVVGGFLWDNVSHMSLFFLAAAVNIVGVLLLMKVRARAYR